MSNFKSVQFHENYMKFIKFCVYFLFDMRKCDGSNRVQDKQRRLGIFPKRFVALKTKGGHSYDTSNFTSDQ